MTYQIEYIYMLFALLLLFLSVIKKTKNNNILGSLLFVIFIGFSKIGADFKGYEINYKILHYNFNNVHGEYLFNKLMQLYISLNISYEYFRYSYLIFLLIIMILVLKKLSVNLFLSLYIMYTLYIIYLCSAYRQFFSMVMCLVGFYYLKRKKINNAIFINFIALFFHGSSIWCLFYFILIKFKKIKISKDIIIYGFLISFILRIIVGRYLGFLAIVLNIKSALPYLDDIKIFSLGLVSRVVLGILICLNFNQLKRKRIIYNIFVFYFLGIIMYIILPYELLAGRLFNNSKILESILIPYIILKNKNHSNKFIYICLFILIPLIVFWNHLLKQIGYVPYKNFLF